MTVASARIGAVRDDFNLATDTLKNVLTHVDAAVIEATLRVAISNNVIVALVSTTEEAIRNAFAEYFSVLEESGCTYFSLRLDVQRANLEGAVSLLWDTKKTVDTNGAKIVVDALSICLSERPGWSLFKDKITYNDGNFRSDQVTAIAKRAGIREIWQLMSNHPDIENYLAEPSVETRKNKLIQNWNGLFDERDVIVHRISQASGWSSQRIDEGIQLCRLVFSRICDCLIDDANTFLAVLSYQGATVQQSATEAASIEEF